MSNLYETVKEMAKEKGLPIYKLEKEAGLANGSVRKWEYGNATLASLKKVADTLEIPLSELVMKVT